MSKQMIFNALGEINIPSEFSQMNYVDTNSNPIPLKESDIDMLWAIIFLTKSELLQSKRTEGIVHITHTKIAELNKKYSNSKYSSFKESLSRLEQLYLQTNTNTKVKGDRCSKTPSKFIMTLKQYRYGFDIEINPSVIRCFFDVGSYFKKVYLNILFNLKGKSAKLLYLFLNDYEGIAVSIEKSKLMGILNATDGKNISIGKEVEKITSDSDIHIHFKTKVVPHKDTKNYHYDFRIERQNYFGFDQKNYDEWIEFYRYRMIVEEAESQYISNSAETQIRNKNAYVSKIIQNIHNNQTQFEEFDNKAVLMIGIERRKVMYGDKRGLIGMYVGDITNGKSEYYAIGDDYRLYDEFSNAITDNATETYKVISDLKQSHNKEFEVIDIPKVHTKCINGCIGF